MLSGKWKSIFKENGLNGFVFVDKPEGISSFLLCAKVRRIFLEKKSGHTGTLDPLATGAMVVALSSATRFIELIPETGKAYKAAFRFGVETDTLDITGKVLSLCDVPVTKERLSLALEKFKGETLQLPPMYSALKKDGVRLYELARKGEQAEREARKINVSELSVLSYDEEKREGELFVACSAGTYVRSLIADIGEALGTKAVMTALRRTKANGASIEQCRTLSELEELSKAGELSKAVSPIEDVLGFERLFVSANQAKRFSNGGELFLERIQKSVSNETLYSIFSPEGEFLGVGVTDFSAGLLRPRKIMSK